MSKIRTCLLPIVIGIQRSTLSKPGTPRFNFKFEISNSQPAKIVMFCKFFNQRLLKSSAAKSTIFTQ